MKNDKYVVMYCNDCIGTFTGLQDAINFIEDCKKDNFYYNDNEHEFSIHVKVEI